MSILYMTGIIFYNVLSLAQNNGKLYLRRHPPLSGDIFSSWWTLCCKLCDTLLFSIVLFDILLFSSAKSIRSASWFVSVCNNTTIQCTLWYVLIVTQDYTREIEASGFQKSCCVLKLPSRIYYVVFFSPLTVLSFLF